jgi:antitoxin component YwqK of YwqJK toxin-antitoxin module
MDSLPIEIIEAIFLLVNPKDYINFILSYNIALCFWRNEKTRERYKKQYLRVVREDFPDCEVYVVKTIRTDNGQNHGKYIMYSKDGQICEDSTYLNNTLCGKFTSYHNNGQISEDMTYIIIDGETRIHGKYIEYHKNGQVRIDATYKNGERHEKCTEYRENGQKQAVTMYENGQVIWSIYRKNLKT